MKISDHEVKIRAAEELLDDYRLMLAESRANVFWFHEAAKSVQKIIERSNAGENSISTLLVKARRYHKKHRQEGPNNVSQGDVETAAFAAWRYYVSQSSQAEQESITLQHYIYDLQGRFLALEKETSS